MKSLILVGILLLPAPVWGQGLILPSAAFIAAQTADLVTTHQVVTSGRGYEANPIMGDGTGARPVLIKIASTGVILWLTHRLAKRGHPTLAKGLLWGGTIGLSAVAVHNHHVGR